MATTAGAVLEVVADLIKALTPTDQVGERDVFTYHSGPPEELPTRDRSFALVPTQHTRHDTIGSCDEMDLEVELRVGYTFSDGMYRRMLDDGTQLVTTISRLVNQASDGDIKHAAQVGSEFEYGEHTATAIHTFTVRYRG